MPIHDWTRVDLGIFHHFHFEWIAGLSRALNDGLLPDDYYALAEQIAGGREPDVLTLERIANPDGGNGHPSAPSSGQVGVAIETNPPKVRYTAVAEPERCAQKKRRIAIAARATTASWR